MLKKLIMAIGAIIAVIVVLFIIAAVIVYVKVDKTFISSQIAQALHRQVYIENIDVSICSIFSGIEIKNMAISNFKTPQELAALEGKPVDKAGLFAGIEALRFKVKIFPLLKRQVELKELVLYSPVINLTKNKQGAMNIDDLLQTKEKPAEERKQEKKPEGKEKPVPIKADAIPVAIVVGAIGMKDGTINYYDGQYDQTFQIYKLTTLAHDVNIDPQDLKNKNEIKVKIGMGIKTVGAMKTGSVQNFDVTLDATGKVIPFDINTRLLDPEAIVHIAIPNGEITGLQIFNTIATIPLLGDYLGEHLSFLKGKQEWKNSRETGLDLRYKAQKAEITNGKIDLKEAHMLFDGGMNIENKAVDLNLGMVMKKEINEAVKTSLAKKLESFMKSPQVKKYVDSGKLATTAMQPLLNQDGLINIQTKVTGTSQKPDVKVTKPQLGSLSVIVKDAAGSMAMEAGKDAAKKVVEEQKQKAIDKIGDLFKKK